MRLAAEIEVGDSGIRPQLGVGIMVSGDGNRYSHPAWKDWVRLCLRPPSDYFGT